MPLPAVLPETETNWALKYQPPYHVVLLNDDDHSYEYVILMLRDLFGHSVETGFEMAKEVDSEGRCIVLIDLETVQQCREMRQFQEV